MQLLEVSGAVRHIYMSLGSQRLNKTNFNNKGAGLCIIN